MYKYGEIKKNDEIVLEPARKKELVNLLKEVIRFIYVRGIIYKTRNSIKYDLYKACASIWKNSEHKNILPKPTKEEKDKLRAELLSLRSGSRYVKGVLGLYHALNSKQEKNGNLEFSDFHIEHILPRAWQHYDGWDKDTYDQKINALGNLTLFERKLNIAAKNEYLQKKQVHYNKSSIIDVKDLVSLSQWTPKEFEARNTDIIKRVTDFLL